MFPIEFVNHASFVMNLDNKRLITDPWLEKRVFNEGWQLLSETKFNYDDFKNIDYIWFSHEHPDHFMPLVIKKIPEEYRAKIKVLYQKTIDERVSTFCQSLNFKEIIELSPNEWYKISENTQIMCTPFGKGDSWLAVKNQNHTILNLNDCPVTSEKDLSQIKEMVGKIDILFHSFLSPIGLAILMILIHARKKQN